MNVIRVNERSSRVTQGVLPRAFLVAATLYVLAGRELQASSTLQALIAEEAGSDKKHESDHY